uniref:Uncharacterized protein n=1 Tax=Anguilla anguilla TaxID=7936 RepID=A0A0E9S735_ANGAN
MVWANLASVSDCSPTVSDFLAVCAFIVHSSIQHGYWRP